MKFEISEFLIKWGGVFKGGGFRGRGFGVGRYHSDLNSGALIFPSDWQTVCIYLLLSLVLLLLSAYSAQVELRLFPKNPLRWHLFVMAEVMNPSDTYEKSWINAWWINMLLWWLSFILLGMAFINFLALFTYKEPINSLGW